MDNQDCDELYISFYFPPSDIVSGITVFKRIVENGRIVDVLQADRDSSNSDLNKYVDEYVNERIVIDIDCRDDWADGIFGFIEKGMKAIKHDYKRICSRSWLMSNHFLAAEYKFSHPDAFWSAEFSDPLIYDLSNNPKTYRQMIIDNEDYIDKINEKITFLNETNNTNFDLVENKSSAYFIAEYLCYLFADEIIFTNENQRKIMLEQFPVDVYDFAFKKSIVRMHPTLDERFYHIRQSDINPDKDYINIAYFGKDYYGKRHFENLFFSLESLNHKYKDKIRIHLFISDHALVKSLVNGLDCSENFIVQEPISYLEFLNASMKFDILIVCDVFTRGNFEVNPYLPSKLSDYLGSSSDIWAFYEPGSSLSKFDLKYACDIYDYDSCRDCMIQILEDRGFADEDCTVNEDYFADRLTALNESYEMIFRRNLRLQEENKRLKRENSEIKSSNSWKVTKPLRKFRNR